MRLFAQTLVAVAVAALAACADGATHTGLGDPPPLTTVPGDAGVTYDAGHPDGGLDGGDAGCPGVAPNATAAFDRCSGAGLQQQVLFGQVDQTTCGVTLYLDSVGTCAGALAGDAGAFAGTCEATSLRCSAPALPGRITCAIPDAGDAGCFIDVCASASDLRCQ